MPIRFRCVYCDRLLGISRRKAGAIVGCPHCKEKLIVPTPSPEEQAAAEDEKETNEDPALAHAKGDGPQLFERDDIEALLQPKPAYRADPAAAPKARPAVAGAAPVAEAVALEPYVPQMVAPPPKPAQPLFESAPPGGGIVLSPSRATWLAVAAVVLLAVAFGVGLLVGRFFRPS
jgi:phage FluMu protein Com